jgi:hypothetical protein
MSDNQSISDQEIRIRAYRLWDAAGRPNGRSEEFWEQAYQQLIAERQSPPGSEAETSSS